MNINTIYLEAVALGIGTGLLAMLLFTVGSVLLTLAHSNWRKITGSAGIGAVSIGLSLPGLALLLFVGVAGFASGFRRRIRSGRR